MILSLNSQLFPGTWNLFIWGKVPNLKTNKNGRKYIYKRQSSLHIQNELVIIFFQKSNDSKIKLKMFRLSSQFPDHFPPKPIKFIHEKKWQHRFWFWKKNFCRIHKSKILDSYFLRNLWTFKMELRAVFYSIFSVLMSIANVDSRGPQQVRTKTSFKWI